MIGSGQHDAKHGLVVRHSAIIDVTAVLSRHRLYQPEVDAVRVIRRRPVRRRIEFGQLLGRNVPAVTPQLDHHVVRSSQRVDPNRLVGLDVLGQRFERFSQNRDEPFCRPHLAVRERVAVEKHRLRLHVTHRFFEHSTDVDSGVVQPLGADLGRNDLHQLERRDDISGRLVDDPCRAAAVVVRLVEQHIGVATYDVQLVPEVVPQVSVENVGVFSALVHLRHVETLGDEILDRSVRPRHGGHDEIEFRDLPAGLDLNSVAERFPASRLFYGLFDRLA